MYVKTRKRLSYDRSRLHNRVRYNRVHHRYTCFFLNRFFRSGFQNSDLRIIKKSGTLTTHREPLKLPFIHTCSPCEPNDATQRRYNAIIGSECSVTTPNDATQRSFKAIIGSECSVTTPNDTTQRSYKAIIGSEYSVTTPNDATQRSYKAIIGSECSVTTPNDTTHVVTMQLSAVNVQ